MSTWCTWLREYASRDEAYQAARFVGAGFVGLLVNLAMTFVLTEHVRLWYLWAFCIGTLLSWTFSFFLNTLLTFRQRPASMMDWFTKYLVYISGYVAFFWINIGVVYTATTHLGLPYLLSISVSAVLTTVGTYVTSRSILTTRLPASLWRHGMALLLAVAVGIICVAPPLYFALSNPHYAGIAMMGSDAEEHYAARIQQVYRGDTIQSNIFRSQKDQPYTVPTVGEILVGGVGRGLGLTASEVVVFSKFLFPLLAALLCYLLVNTLFASRRMALLATAAVMLGDNLLSSLGAWYALVQGTSNATGFIAFARPINPEVAALFLFGGLYLMYKGIYVRDKSSTRYTILTGVLIGISLYVSPYVFTFLGVVTLFSFLLALYERDWARAKAFLSAGIVALIGALPFVLNFLSLRVNPEYAAFALRQGLVSTHAPVFSVWLLVMFFAIILWPKQHSIARRLFGTSTVALVVLTQQQVLTGIALQPSHYHWYITKPLVSMLLVWGGLLLVEKIWKQERIRVAAVALGVGVLLYNAVLVQTSSYHAAYAAALAAQRYAPVLATLNTLPPQNVWTDPELALYVAIYTQHNALNNGYAVYYLNPPEFYTGRLLLSYRLAGLVPREALARFVADRALVSQALFGMLYREAAGGYAAIPDKELVTLAGAYRSFVARPYAEIFHELGIQILVISSSRTSQSLVKERVLFKDALGTMLVVGPVQ